MHYGVVMFPTHYAIRPDELARAAEAKRNNDIQQGFLEGSNVKTVEEMIDLVVSGELFEMARFRETPPALRRLNDLAFSGDGEPTTCPEFLEIVESVAAIKRRRGLDRVKLVLITNATRLHVERVRQVLSVFDANNGEIWAKLEAGTEEYYRLVERTTVPFAQVLTNLREAARGRPIVIQAMFLRMHEQPPSLHELNAFCDRLNEVTAAGGRIQLVQVYTVARVPAESWVTPLSDAEVDAIAALVRRRTGLEAEPFYGPGAQEDKDAACVPEL